MKFYVVASAVQNVKEWRKAGFHNFLFSYYYFKDPQKLLRVKEELQISWNNIFIDSGAFSAWSKGTPIKIEDYIAYIQELQPKVYANLDVIGDWKATDQNLRIMEANGLDPLPVWHIGDPLSLFKQYLQNYDYVAIGGLVSNKVYDPKILSKIALYAKGINPRIKLHYFGLSPRTVLKIRHLVYSSDSAVDVMIAHAQIIYEGKAQSLKGRAKTTKTYKKIGAKAFYDFLSRFPDIEV